jgi:uncharacterized protein (TIGR00297 family)
MTVMQGAVLGLASATALLPLTVWAGWLTWGGAGAALLVAVALVVGEGWTGVLLLLAFFATSSMLTKAGRPRRGLPEGAPDRDAEGRSASQVFANGGVAASCALLGVVGLGPATHYAAAAALAAATADTWASEIGVWAGGGTRLLTDWQRVEPGRSGGVSWAGTMAGLAGALMIGALAALAWGQPEALAAVSLGGVGGMLVDSWVGAAWEHRVSWIGNDAVNWLGTAAGAGLGMLIAAA